MSQNSPGLLSVVRHCLIVFLENFLFLYFVLRSGTMLLAICSEKKNYSLAHRSLDLKPRLAKLLTPCLPAYLLLAGFRYHDHAKDEAGLTGLFGAVHLALKDTISVFILMRVSCFVFFFSRVSVVIP